VLLDREEGVREPLGVALVSVGDRNPLVGVPVVVDDDLLLVADHEHELVGTQLGELVETV